MTTTSKLLANADSCCRTTSQAFFSFPEGMLSRKTTAPIPRANTRMAKTNRTTRLSIGFIRSVSRDRRSAPLPKHASTIGPAAYAVKLAFRPVSVKMALTQGALMSIKAKLTTFDATMIVVSLIIGIGIFRTPAMVAAAAKTPALFYAAWGLGGLISFIGALTFAEIGGRFAKPGSYYKVVAENYSSGLAFMLNWTNVVFINGAGAAAVAIIGAEYLTPIFFPGTTPTTASVQVTAVILI